MAQINLLLPKAALIICALLLLWGCGPQGQAKSGELASTALVENSVKPAPLDTSELKYLMGKFTPEQDGNFVAIQPVHADQAGRYIRKEAYDAFIKMYQAAMADGIHLQIKSATRNFDYQKGIWERKWTGETKLSTGEDASIAYTASTDRATNILKYSSMPGTSRHHWGTDIDLNNFNNAWFESGEGLKLFNWLEDHAHAYGYCRPYTAKDNQRPDGYNEEKWHWSYMPISQNLTDLAEAFLEDEMLSGFMGSEVAPELGIVKKYVLGINHGCRH